MTRTILPQPTVQEIAAELRNRIAANQREATNTDDNRRITAKVCERTAMELERLLTWIEGSNA